MIIFLISILLFSVSTSFSMWNHDTPIEKWLNQPCTTERDWPQPTALEIEQLDNIFGFGKNGIKEKNNLIDILSQPGMGYQEKLTILWNNHTHNTLFDALVSIYHDTFPHIDELLLGTATWSSINMQLLIQAGANPNYYTEPDKTTLLMMAAISEQYRVCEVILTNGGNANLTDINNMTALGWAIEAWSTNGDGITTVMTLLALKSDPNIRIYNPNWPGPEYNDLENVKKWGSMFRPKFYNSCYMLDMTIIKALVEWYFYKVYDPSNTPASKRIDRIKELNQIIQLFKQFNGRTSEKSVLTTKVNQALTIMHTVIGKSAAPLSDIVKQYLDGQTPEPTGDTSIEHWFKSQFPHQHLVIRLNN